MTQFVSIVALAILGASCASPAAGAREWKRRPRGYVLAAGERLPVDVPVITYLDAGGFDGRASHRWFTPSEELPGDPASGCDTASRFSERRGGPPPHSLAELRERVTQFVVHYDVAVTSSNCFRVLHDPRGLSVHFLLDVDGTVYQTLDLTARARHAGANNDRSIGIEIAHPGAWTTREGAGRFYGPDGVWLEIPAQLEPPRSGPFSPARPGWFTARLNGSEVHQRDFTETQYRSLAALLAALRETFPALNEGPPSDDAGDVLRDVLPEERRSSTRGLLGHVHVSAAKVDPGPAFDWSRIAGPGR